MCRLVIVFGLRGGQLSVHGRDVHLDAQSADGVLAEHRDVFQHSRVELLLALFGPVTLLVPSVLLAVHLGEQVDLDGAQRGRQHVEAALQRVAEGGAQAQRGARQVRHRLAHHARALQEVQRAFLGRGLRRVRGAAAARRGRLLRVAEQVPRAVGEVGGGAAQRQQGQVQVACRFGQGVEEQPQLEHGVSCGINRAAGSALIQHPG